MALPDLRRKEQAHCGQKLKLAARYATSGQEPIQEIHRQWEYLILTLLVFTHLVQKQSYVLPLKMDYQSVSNVLRISSTISITCLQSQLKVFYLYFIHHNMFRPLRAILR
jgi:hypothetical protein